MSAVPDNNLCGCTIGVISMNPSSAADLYMAITEVISNAGISLDQDHPEMFICGLATSCLEDLKSAADLCKDFGVDAIAIAECVSEDILIASFGYLELPIFAMTGGIMDSRALASAVTNHFTRQFTPVRPNILYKDANTTCEALQKDRDERKLRMHLRQESGGYPILQQYSGRFAGVLGGAGPLASAAFCVKCADFGVPFVCYSNTSAPSKNDYEVNGGPSYIDHYKTSCSFFADVDPAAFVITCNTAHMRLNEYLEPFESLCRKFVDIRSGILNDSSSRCIGDKAILFGTKRTTGVGLAEDELGLYEQYRRATCSECELIVCTLDQQVLISSAIVDVKAGMMSASSRPPSDKVAIREDGQPIELAGVFAREKILQVVNEIRSFHGGNFPVVFGCTELPLPFSMIEMSFYGLIDPAQKLVEDIREVLLDSSKRRSPVKRSVPNISNG